MKSVEVPYIEGLENMDRATAEALMEERGARVALDEANWPAEYPYKPIVSALLAASDSHLFVNFFVRGLGLKAEHSATNDPVWSDSCVEVFVEHPQGGYRNLEMNCIGALLSSYQKARRVDVKRITDEEAAEIIRFTSLPGETFTEIDGVHEWTVTMGVPFKLLGFGERPEELRCNFYKCADGSRWRHYLSWSPIDTPKPDFHRPEFFGTLRLAPVDA